MDQVFRQFFSWSTVRPYIGDLARGFWVTLQIAFLASAICLTLGLVLALMRRADFGGQARIARIGGRIVRGAAIAYIDVFRAVPALLILLLMDGSAAQLPVPVVRDLTSFQVSFIALGLTYAAYVAEVYRSGIESVDAGQHEAARSLGMSRRQTMRDVILPQAFRRIVPPLLNDFIALSKDTALAGVLAVGDVVSVARDVQSLTLNGTGLVGAATFYLAFTLPLIRILDRMLARQQRKTGRRQVMTP
ncbi:MAG: amino acid ABC transporter permease [Actinobacteria bacterium]|nr:amino acid ABC transporter permease [Actinomycetota bacterium]